MDNATTILIDLSARYAAAFGIVKASEMLSEAFVSKDENHYMVDYYSPTEIESLYFIYQSKVLEFGKMMGENNNVFAPPLIMNFTKEKELIETATNGGDNVVVERWATKPWDITIEGLLIDCENRHYPSDQITELHRFFEINDTIEVIGKVFSEKNIDSIYFKNISIVPLEGFSDTISFKLSASSIKEVNWTLETPNTQ